MLLKTTRNDNAAVETVRVAAPARLHLGFLDLNGGRQRRFGSIGVGITGFSTVVNVSHSDQVHVSGADDEYIASVARTVLDHFRVNSGVRVHVEECIPRHQGLGSGTQMALALGTAITGLYGIDADIEDIALATGRGRRSGVGLGVFTQGGFVLDSGRSEGRRLPLTVFRHDFPEPWRFVLVMDARVEGISGADEVEAFNSLPDMPAQVCAEICRQVLIYMLPGIMERDCERFGASVSSIQASIGACFSAVQGGCYASDNVRQALEFLLEHGATGMGQTSWGPTGFAVFPDDTSAQRAIDAFAGRDEKVSLLLAGAENNRAQITKGVYPEIQDRWGPENCGND